MPELDLPLLSDLPVLGPILFRHDLVVYLGIALVAAVWWFLYRTRAGLTLRAVGENHDAAHALGTQGDPRPLPRHPLRRRDGGARRRLPVASCACRSGPRA